MPNLPEINTQFLLDFLTRLLNTPSPTGLAEPAIALTEQTLKPFPTLKLSRTRKGALLATWPGERDDCPRALTAHADTLGAMVKEIKSNGRLKLSQIGGYAWNNIEGERSGAGGGGLFRGPLIEGFSRVSGTHEREGVADGPRAGDCERIAIEDLGDSCRGGRDGDDTDQLEINGVHVEAGIAAAGVSEGDGRLGRVVGDVAYQSPSIDRVGSLECGRGHGGLGSAAGTANALTPMPGEVNRADVDRLAREVEVTRISQ